MPALNKLKGFTLIELLVAISIVAILSTIGIVVFSNASVKARDTTRKNALKQIQIALELYYEETGKYPTPPSSSSSSDECTKIEKGTLGEKLDKYLKNPPKDPKHSEDPKYKYCYKLESNGEYLLSAKLENCEESNVNKEACTYVISSDESFIAQAPIIPTPKTFIPINIPNPISKSFNRPTPITPPSPLKVFVTSATYTGDLGGTSGADQKCKALADGPGSQAPQGKLWRAWLSDSTNAKDRISDGKYVRIDGQTIATSKADLLDGDIALPIDLTEQWDIPSIEMNPQAGILETYPYVWTGTQGNGDQKLNGTCGNWNKPETADGAFGVVRGGGVQGNEWSYFSPGGNQCQTFRRHLYCFEQVSPQSNPGPGCLEGYQDFDNDTFTTGPAQYFCGVAELPFGYKSSASTAGDCYDMNPDVKPDQTQYFPQDRGDGSYDYDCDNSATPRFGKVGESCAQYSIAPTSSCVDTFIAQACRIGRTTTPADCSIDRSYTDSSPTVYQGDEGGCDLILGNRYMGKLPCK